MLQNFLKTAILNVIKIELKVLQQVCLDVDTIFV